MEELKRIRESKGLSQAKLAQLAGLNPVTVHRIEHGHKSPTVKTLESLARVLGVEVGDLFPKAGRRSPRELSLLDGLEEERRLSYLSSWRAYVWKLAKRWENEPPKTPSEVSVILDAMQALIDEGAFQRPPDELTTSDRGEFGEWFELNQLFRGLDRLNRIAEDVEADTEAERRRAAFQQIQGQMTG